MRTSKIYDDILHMVIICYSREHILTAVTYKRYKSLTLLTLH